MREACGSGQESRGKHRTDWGPGDTHSDRVVARGVRAEVGSGQPHGESGWDGTCHSGPCFPSNPDTISQQEPWPHWVSEQGRGRRAGAGW